MSDAICANCGINLNEPGAVYYMCDELMSDYCPDCWQHVHCEEKHGEGCATFVVVGDDSDAPK